MARGWESKSVADQMDAAGAARAAAAPEAAAAAWYGMRAWIEQGFKLTKRAGWQWQRTRITDPARAARLWLAVAVATLWLVRVGGAADAAITESTVGDLTPVATVARRQRRATQARLVGVFRRGWLQILVALLDQAPLPLGVLVPESWPTRPALTRHHWPDAQAA